ncbi:MAG TPA: hypothetical protein VGB64_10565 [Actinomycetota bacterium]
MDFGGGADKHRVCFAKQQEDRYLNAAHSGDVRGRHPHQCRVVGAGIPIAFRRDGVFHGGICVGEDVLLKVGLGSSEVCVSRRAAGLGGLSTSGAVKRLLRGLLH